MLAEQFGVDPDYQPSVGMKRKIVVYGLRFVALVIGLNVILLVLSLVLNPRIDGPGGSSVVTTGAGVGAWRETLERLGVDVGQLRVPLAEAELVSQAADSRLIVLDPDARYVDDAYRAAVVAYLDAGGTLITDPNGAFLLDVDFGAIPVFDPDGVEVERVVTELADVAEMQTTDWSMSNTRTPLVESSRGDALVATEGGVILLADAALVSNQSIGLADNGVLAVRISGTGAVYFDEYVHGFGIGQGLAGVPTAMVSLGMALMAVVIWMWGVGSRFGPPQQADRALPPPRAAYLDGVAASLRRTTPTDAGFGILRSRAQGLVERYGERFAGAGAGERRRLTAEALGLSQSDLAVLDRPITSAEQAIAAASIAAKIEQTRMERAE